MPPVDNTSAPTPGNPKKGFFAKLKESLFHSKKTVEQAPVVPPHMSQTPPPQLDDNANRDTLGAEPVATQVVEQPVVPVQPVVPEQPAITTPQSTITDVTSPNGNPVGPELSKPVPTVSPDSEPQTINVPQTVTAEPVDSNEGQVAPTLPTQPPTAAPPEVPNQGPPSNPAQ